MARPLHVACCSFHSPGLPEDDQSWATTEADNLGFSAASTGWARIVLAVRHYEVRGAWLLFLRPMIHTHASWLAVQR